MATINKTCNCPGCFETIVGDSEGVDVCDDCQDADCDPFEDTDECRAVEQAIDAAEDDLAHECPSCYGPGEVLGVLGNLTHYRCRNCGQDWS